ncbi:hypothetical protein DICVIV_10187 [Dictyocaulus viviparus]|uniref:Uncharacterized protein n=1 Tax=Dictyocaulus viviparus TaxID=29172 RepID=A0A0D8XGK0_DICVI|nr:hypothetical protein DICVIV_10187 [Dictyocaulus viviparus]
MSDLFKLLLFRIELIEILGKQAKNGRANCSLSENTILSLMLVGSTTYRIKLSDKLQNDSVDSKFALQHTGSSSQTSSKTIALIRSSCALVHCLLRDDTRHDTGLQILSIPIYLWTMQPTVHGSDCDETALWKIHSTFDEIYVYKNSFKVMFPMLEASVEVCVASRILDLCASDNFVVVVTDEHIFIAHKNKLTVSSLMNLNL